MQPVDQAFSQDSETGAIGAQNSDSEHKISIEETNSIISNAVKSPESQQLKSVSAD